MAGEAAGEDEGDEHVRSGEDDVREADLHLVTTKFVPPRHGDKHESVTSPSNTVSTAPWYSPAISTLRRGGCLNVFRLPWSQIRTWWKMLTVPSNQEKRGRGVQGIGFEQKVQ